MTSTVTFPPFVHRLCCPPCTPTPTPSHRRARRLLASSPFLPVTAPHPPQPTPPHTPPPPHTKHTRARTSTRTGVRNALGSYMLAERAGVHTGVRNALGFTSFPQFSHWATGAASFDPPGSNTPGPGQLLNNAVLMCVCLPLSLPPSLPPSLSPSIHMRNLAPSSLSPSPSLYPSLICSTL